QDESKCDHSWFDNADSVVIQSNETTKDLWDALERQMRGSEYGKQDRKAAILYEYETFKAIEGEQLLDTYLRYLQILKHNQGDVNDALGYKKKAVVVTSDPLALVAEKTKVNKRKEKIEKKDDEKKKDMSKVKCYNYKKEGHFAKDYKKAKVKDYNYYKTKMLLAKKDSDEQVLLAEDQAWIESSSDSDKEINANMVFMDQIVKVLLESDKSSSSAEETIAEVAYYTSESESEFEFETLEFYDNSTNYGLFVNNDDNQENFHDAIESASENFIKNHIDSQKDYDKSEVDHNDSEEKEHLVDKLIRKFNHKIAKCQKHIEKANQQSSENPSYFEKAKDLRPSLYDDKVIGLGYTLMFLIHSDEALEIEKFKRARENKIDFAYDYGNLNASYVNEKIIFSDDYFQEIINPNFEKIDSPFQQTSLLKPYVPNVIAPRMFKLSVSQSVSPISVTKTSSDSKNVENLDAFSSVRRTNNSGVILKKKGTSNTSNVDLSSVSLLKLNKNVKQYSRKDSLSCNNSHFEETSSAYVCNDAMNVSCNSRMCDLFDENNLFIFDDESVRISPVSMMPFRKKPRDLMNVGSKSNSNKSLPRTVHRWLPKLQPLAEPVAKWFPRIVQICLWIIDSGFLKHMTGNRSLLTNFGEKFLGTVRFGNNDFVVIAGYRDVVIRSMTIKKVYYVEGLGYNLFSVGQFCDKGLEVAFQKSTCFVQNEHGVDLLTGDRSSNLYTIALNEVATNSSTCLLAKASSSQSWLWHQRKIHRKHHKSKTAFASNKPLYLLHMDLCGPMRIESINGNQYVIVVVDDYSRYTWVFFLHSKEEASDVIIYFIKKTQVNLQLQVQRVRTDNGTKFKNKTLAKFFDEVGITQQFSDARTPQQNGVVERRNRTLVEAARTMLTFANLPLFL
nr:hypothetical protein [Tanacetum cinerariifolium]